MMGKVIASWRMALLSLIALTALGNAPVTYRLDGAASSITAKVPFLGLGSKTASFDRLSGGVSLNPNQPSKAKVDVTIHTRNIKAPDALTLKRLKSEKFFWVDKYPTARFVGTNLTMTGARTGKISGKLTVRGVARPETLNVTFDREPTSAVGEVLTITGKMKINRRNYGMKSYNLIVGKTVTISLKARMVPS